MTREYEKLETERFKLSLAEGHQRIEIPARRNWFIIPFLMFWLVVWTTGGIAAFVTLFTNFSLFICFWFIGWALGWAFAAATLSWQLTGKELIRVVGQDLEVGYEMLGTKRMKLYRGGDVRRLMVDDAGNLLRYFQISIPFYHGANFGTIKFDYGAKTFRFGSGVDEAEAHAIVAILISSLPETALIP